MDEGRDIDEAGCSCMRRETPAVLFVAELIIAMVNRFSSSVC